MKVIKKLCVNFWNWFVDKFIIIPDESDQFRMLIQINPSAVCDVNSEDCLVQSAVVRSLIENSTFYETCNKPIIDIEHTGASLTFNINRKSALFFWGKFCKSKFEGFSDKPFFMFFPYENSNKNCELDKQQTKGEQKSGVEIKFSLLSHN